MHPHGVGNISTAGGGGGKIKWVDTIAERDALTPADGTIVRVRNAYQDDDSVSYGWAEYTYHSSGDPSTWEKTSEEEGFDEKYVPEVPDATVSILAVGPYPAGTPASTIKANPPSWRQIEDERVFPTIPYVYDPPSASVNVTDSSIEVGEVFNQEVIASFDQDDAGSANRVQIQINEIDVQDTSSPSLDYSYDDDNQVLADGENRRYRCIISYDEGPVKQNNKGQDQAGNILAGNVTSVTRTKTARRKIFAQMSANKPASSAEARALTSSQFDNDNTLNLAVINGDTSLTIVLPANKTLLSAIYQSTLGINADHTQLLLDSEEILSVEGGGPGYSQNARLLHLQPQATYTPGTYVLIFTDV